MTIDEAVKELQKSIDEIGNDEIDALTKAEKLGIEALKFRLGLEQEDPEITLEPLPGETK